jgi:hypothetical protein
MGACRRAPPAYLNMSEAVAKIKRRPLEAAFNGSTMFSRTRLLVIRLTLTLHLLFVLLHHFLLHLLPFGLLVRC